MLTSNIAWMRGKGEAGRPAGGLYITSNTDVAWMAWRAAGREASPCHILNVVALSVDKSTITALLIQLVQLFTTTTASLFTTNCYFIETHKKHAKNNQAVTRPPTGNDNSSQDTKYCRYTTTYLAGIVAISAASDAFSKMKACCT